MVVGKRRVSGAAVGGVVVGREVRLVRVGCGEFCVGEIVAKEDA